MMVMGTYFCMKTTSSTEVTLQGAGRGDTAVSPDQNQRSGLSLLDKLAPNKPDHPLCWWGLIYLL